jgi:hypothetical protein
MNRPLLLGSAHAEPQHARRTRLELLAVGLALAALVLSPIAAASGTAGSSATTPAGASTGVWAWGAIEAVSDRAIYLGAYTDSLNLTSGNLSHSVGVIGELSQANASYLSYAVINATAPTTTTRSIETAAISEANYTAIVEINGTLPEVGTYAPGDPVPLVNTTGIYYASILAVSFYVGYANYTFSNGTLALVNEHIAALEEVNETSILYHWPGYVNDANGSTTVTSTTAGAVALAWVGESFASTFSPALPISESPLSVGKNWTATSKATIVGWDAYKTASAYRNGATNTSSAYSGAVSLNTTATLGFTFKVTGTETVVFPNGTTATGYAVTATNNGTGSSAYTLWDGLAVLPASGGPAPPALAPAAPGADVPYAAPGGPSSTSIVAGSGFPVATSASVSASTVLSTAPLPTSQAQQAISSAGVPAAPVSAQAPTVTNPPSLGISNPTSGSSGTTPPSSNSGSTPPTSSTPKSNPPVSTTPAQRSNGLPTLGVYWLALAVVAIGLAGLAIQVARRRRSV